MSAIQVQISHGLPGPISTLEVGFFWTRTSLLGVEFTEQPREVFDRLMMQARESLIVAPTIAARAS